MNTAETIRKIKEWTDYHDWNLSRRSSLIAVSGGPDSMALLGYMYAAGHPIQVAHVNYGFRGEDSDADQALVENYCAERDIPCHVLVLDGSQILAETGENLQDWARSTRYEFFEKVQKREKLYYIATAHQADDNIETFLMRILQGAGLEGLSGIPAERGRIVRPLLTLSRNEIEDYISEQKIPYRIDETNRESKYKRNKLRNELIPHIRALYPDGYPLISKSIQHLAESNTIYKPAMYARLQRLWRDHRYYKLISIASIQKLNPRATLIYELFRPYGLKSKQLHEVEKLLTALPGSLLDLGEYQLIRDRRDVLLVREKDRTEVYVPLEAGDKVSNAHFNLASQQMVYRSDWKNTDTEFYLDMAGLEFPLIVRTWREGDYFYPEGLNKKKKISDYYKDLKLNKIEKQDSYLLCSGKRICAVLGHRMDHRFIARPGQACLRIRYQRK